MNNILDGKGKDKERLSSGKGNNLSVEDQIENVFSHKYTDEYINDIVDSNSEAWKSVQYDWETCAWNITGSTEIDDNLELL